MGLSPTQQGALLGCYSITYLADPRPISRSEALSFLFRVSISSDAARSPVCCPSSSHTETTLFAHQDDSRTLAAVLFTGPTNYVSPSASAIKFIR